MRYEWQTDSFKTFSRYDCWYFSKPSSDCTMKDATRHNMRSIYLLILTVWGTFLLTSCSQKELEYSGEPVKLLVRFNWQEAPSADPEGMTLLFFPADETSKFWRFDITGREGGEIELLSGNYRVLAYNNDLPGINFVDTDSYDRLSASARSINDSITTATGMLYSVHLSSAFIFNSEDSRPLIELTPDSISSVYHIRLDSVSGTERIKTANAVIKGLARSVCLQLQRNSVESCSLSTPLHISPQNRSSLETVTTGFGLPDVPDPKIILEVIVTTSHGKYSKSFDVTRQVVNCKYPKDVDININGLDIPAADNPVNPDGNPDVGISVGVDGWQLIEILYS